MLSIHSFVSICDQHDHSWWMILSRVVRYGHPAFLLGHKYFSTYVCKTCSSWTSNCHNQSRHNSHGHCCPLIALFVICREEGICRFAKHWANLRLVSTCERCLMGGQARDFLLMFFFFIIIILKMMRIIVTVWGRVWMLVICVYEGIVCMYVCLYKKRGILCASGALPAPAYLQAIRPYSCFMYKHACIRVWLTRLSYSCRHKASIWNVWGGKKQEDLFVCVNFPGLNTLTWPWPLCHPLDAFVWNKSLDIFL